MLQGLRYSDIFINDITYLSKIMSDAFANSIQEHQYEGGYNNDTLLRRLCYNPNNICKKIVYQREVIGAFILNKHTENKYELKMLFISPKFENNGFGTAIWKDIEANFMQVKEWYVEVPSYSDKVHYFFTVKCEFSYKNMREYASGTKVVGYEKLR